MDEKIDATVLGSFNIDFLLTTERNPYPGETINSSSLQIYPGGKGNNQAVALGKLGARTVMLGCVGNDEHGDMLIKNLKNNDVNEDYVLRVNDKTGIAFINIFQGENTIILHKGANGYCTIENMGKYIDVIKNSKILLTQMEVPYETIKWALKTAHSNGVLTVFNPAPASKIEDELWQYIDVTVTNEIESKIVLGMDVNENISYEELIRLLLLKGVKNAVITLGSKGVKYNYGNSVQTLDAIKTNVVDTTGAGDSFIGGLVFGLSKGKDIADAVKIGNKLASIKIGFLGAQNYIVDINMFEK